MAKAKPFLIQQQAKRDRVEELAEALSQISGALVSVGLGKVVLGRLARHMLKLRRK